MTSPTSMRSIAALICAGFALLPAPARAAEAYDGCTGYITTLPTTIGTQGTWCMTKDLTTAIATGTAITVNAHNVTIDCNHFKLGGLAAGLGTATSGIRSDQRSNLSVRHCNVRGFRIGVDASTGDGGHVIEDSRFDGNTAIGIRVYGDGSLVQRNQVLHTGGTTGDGSVTAILAQGSVQILDNQIEGVTNGTADKSGVYGIQLGPTVGGRIAGNAISGLLHGGEGGEIAIAISYAFGATVRGNDIVGVPTKSGTGILCFESNEIVRDNSIIGMVPLFDCDDSGGNYTLF